MLLDELRNEAAGLAAEVLFGRALAPYTTLGIGGEAEFLIMPKSWTAAVRILDFLWRKGFPFKVFSGGSNLLVQEERLGYGAVRLKDCGGSARWEDDGVEVDADYPLAALCNGCAERGLAGIEGLAGIPGTVGGALATNAGAFGNEIGASVASVALVEPGRGVHWRGACEFIFGYRSSDVARRGAIAACRLRLGRGDTAELKGRIESCRARRSTTQPWKAATAGCVFRNPPGDHAGRVLESLGFKGKRRGGAAFSDIHANFLVNVGDATFEDAIGLCEEAREAAGLAGFGLDYELEVWRKESRPAPAVQCGGEVVI